MRSEPLESDDLDHSRRHERLGNLGQASAPNKEEDVRIETPAKVR